MLFKEKIDNILKFNTLKINTVYGLEKHIGASVGSIRKYYDQNTEPGLRTIKKIWENINVNEAWWETGKGEIFIEKHTQVGEPSLKYEAAVTDIEEVKVPLVEYRAYAGYLLGHADREYMESLPTISVDREMVRGGHYICFTIMGDSMNDGTWRALLDRDKVLGKELQRHHWANKIHLNSYPFIIVHRTDGIVCKDIVAHDVEKGIITVHSRNPIYEDYTMNLTDVLQIFFVVQLVARGMKS